MYIVAQLVFIAQHPPKDELRRLEGLDFLAAIFYSAAAATVTGAVFAPLLASTRRWLALITTMSVAGLLWFAAIEWPEYLYGVSLLLLLTPWR